jgi:hypothetical protein
MRKALLAEELLPEYLAAFSETVRSNTPHR